MKKQIVFLSILFALSHGTKNNASPSIRERKGNIESAIVTAYIEGFGAASDFSIPMKQETIAKINNALDEINKFVLNALWIKKDLLTDSLEIIKNANNKLLDAVRLSRSTDLPETQDQITNNFLDIITKMTQVIEKLNKKWYVGETKNAARSLLINAAEQIKSAAQYSKEAQKKQMANKKIPLSS